MRAHANRTLLTRCFTRILTKAESTEEETRVRQQADLKVEESDAKVDLLAIFQSMILAFRMTSFKVAIVFVRYEESNPRFETIMW